MSSNALIDQFTYTFLNADTGIRLGIRTRSLASPEFVQFRAFLKRNSSLRSGKNEMAPIFGSSFKSVQDQYSKVRSRVLKMDTNNPDEEELKGLLVEVRKVTELLEGLSMVPERTRL
jgi:hypothetical protein